ncbi:MAG: hypothetical protein KDD75_01085 [Caldilineaceae bacterium]|nr:hypothetical protein [Caldilineaceae bacterium]
MDATEQVRKIEDMDNTLISTPMVAELAGEIERIRMEAGLTTEELLVSLREQRVRYYAEHYAPK